MSELIAPKAITPESNRKFCIFSHFNPNEKLARYVKYYLEELIECEYEIVFVSTSQLSSEADLQYLENSCYKVLVRENIGYDFSSYRDGIKFLFDQELIPQYLIIANDSVFGPITSLKPVIEQMEEHPSEMTGLTDSFDIGHHIQSYFILYKGELLKHPDFKEFWDSVSPVDESFPNFKQEIIRRYEVGGTQHFVARGHQVSAIFRYTPLIKSFFEKVLARLEAAANDINSSSIKETSLRFHLNATHYYWKQLLENGLPFIKRELLTKNPTNTDISDWPQKIDQCSDYDLSLITDALIDLGLEERLYTIHSSTASKTLKKTSDTLRVALNDTLSHLNKLGSAPAFMDFKFDEETYLRTYPDVREAIKDGKCPDAISHYQTHGENENRIFPITRA